ncbi:MAG: hypothetical protein JO050_03790, partial [Acidimicrobiia bacterium]|nr:hypothetical protein [Acidimicrobiia bacterium]
MRIGVLATVLAIVALVIFPFIGGAPDIDTGPYVVLVVVAAAAWWLAYRDVELSTKFMLALEGASVAIVMLIAVVFFARTGRVMDAHQFSTAGLTSSGLVQGLVLAFFSFVGFESATALGHEAK